MPGEIQVQATSRTLTRVLSDPITWVPFLPFAAAYSFLGAPWWICATGAALAGTGIVAWWRRHWDTLRQTQEIALRKEEARLANLRIEHTLTELTPRLPAACGTAFRLALPNFLANKRHVDAAIFEDERVTPVEAEIGTMIADLAHAWLADLDRLANGTLGDTEIQRLITSVEKGIATMQNIRADLDLLIRPSAGLDPTVASAATEQAKRLESRLAEARQIRDRLVRDLQPGDTETTDTTTQPNPTVPQ
jgi:hypothetical protein